jgi:Na+-translocating ferredoxin:NAD+ oxidoreductase RnfG subunit
MRFGLKGMVNDVYQARITSQHQKQNAAFMKKVIKALSAFLVSRTLFARTDMEG